MFRQESTTDYVNSIQDAINEAKAKAEDFNSREKVGDVPLQRTSPHSNCYILSGENYRMHNYIRISILLFLFFQLNPVEIEQEQARNL